MKIRKQITIVAEILVDEDFDTNWLCICQQITNSLLDQPDEYVGCSDDFEIVEYISQEILDRT